MPNRRPPAQKRRALEPLDLDDNNHSIVQGLTGIPSPTRHDWRKQRLPDNPALSGQKSSPFPKTSGKNQTLPQNHPPPPTPKTPLYTYCIDTF